MACREGKLPELTERDTEPEGVREAMTMPASRAVPSIFSNKEQRRDDVANVGLVCAEERKKRCRRGQRVCLRDYMLFRVCVPGARLT